MGPARAAIGILVAGAMLGASPLARAQAPQSDLSLGVAATATVGVGNDISLAADVTNGGPDPAGASSLTVDLPSGVVLEAASSPAGPCTGDSDAVTCDLGTIGAGTTVTASVIATAVVSGTLTTTATASSSSSDPDPSDDTGAPATRVRGSDCTATGTTGDDVLTGTADADVLCGLWGADAITAGEGADLLVGDAGEDTLAGEGGDDVLDGGGTADLLDGGPGTDLLWGKAGADVLMGQEGEDFLAGGDDDDTNDGGPDTDTCVPGPGTDITTSCLPPSPSDGNDANGTLDVRLVRTKLDGRRPTWEIVNTGRMRIRPLWDRGYLVLFLDTRSGEGPDRKAIVRFTQGAVTAALVGGGHRRHLHAVRSSRHAVRVRVPLGRLPIEALRTFYRWRVETIYDGGGCRRVCFDPVPDTGSLVQPLP